MHHPQYVTMHILQWSEWCSLCKYVSNHGAQQEDTVISKTMYNCVHSAATPIQFTGKERSDTHSCKQHSEYAQRSLD